MNKTFNLNMLNEHNKAKYRSTNYENVYNKVE